MSSSSRSCYCFTVKEIFDGSCGDRLQKLLVVVVHGMEHFPDRKWNTKTLLQCREKDLLQKISNLSTLPRTWWYDFLPAFPDRKQLQTNSSPQRGPLVMISSFVKALNFDLLCVLTQTDCASFALMYSSSPYALNNALMISLTS